MPALWALRGFGGRVDRGDRSGAGQKADGFAEPGNMALVDCHNHGGCALLSPFHRI